MPKETKKIVDLFLLILISTSKIEVIKCDIMILRLGTSNQTQIEPNPAALNVYIIIIYKTTLIMTCFPFQRLF